MIGEILLEFVINSTLKDRKMQLEKQLVASFLSDNTAHPAVQGLAQSWADKNGKTLSFLTIGEQARKIEASRTNNVYSLNIAMPMFVLFGIMTLVILGLWVLMYVGPQDTESRRTVSLWLTGFLSIFLGCISLTGFVGHIRIGKQNKKHDQWLEKHAKEIEDFNAFVSEVYRLMSQMEWTLEDLLVTYGWLKTKSQEVLYRMGAEVAALQSDRGLKAKADLTFSQLHVTFLIAQSFNLTEQDTHIKYVKKLVA